jgi:ubiquinone/menaquinone biosynthesis C-methylase UbiE
MKLNLGCSDRHERGFVNVDVCPPADRIADLRERWPWDDNSVDEIRAWDIFEHLPDKIHTLNEAYRVLKTRGILHMIVPTTDGRGAWQDPTHCSYWNPNSLFYLEDGNAHNIRFANAYGMRHRFKILSEWHKEFPDKVWKLSAELRAVK